MHIIGLGNHRSGFDWMSALDYYTCRRGHGMTMDPSIAHLETQVYTHVCNRYSHYLTYPRYISNFKGLLVNELIHVIQNSKEKPFQLHMYSGHDINILGLLYVLNATIIHPEYGTAYYWPDFGTTLALEIVGEQDIRVYLNAEPCTLVRSDTLGNKVHTHIMTLDDLRACNQTYSKFKIDE